MSKLFPFVAYLAKFFCNTTTANWSHSTEGASFEANALICQAQKLTFSCSISLWSMVDHLNWKFSHFRAPKSKLSSVCLFLTLFLPTKDGISPYMSVTWPSLVGIGLINHFYKNCAHKQLFFNEKKFRKIRTIFDIENSLWKSKIGTNWPTDTGWRHKIW